MISARHTWRGNALTPPGIFVMVDLLPDVSLMTIVPKRTPQMTRHSTAQLGGGVWGMQ